MRKTLHLRRETLNELADAQLESVAGGISAGPTCSLCWSFYYCPVPTMPIRECPVS